MKKKFCAQEYHLGLISEPPYRLKPQTKKQRDRIAALKRRGFVQLLMKQKGGDGIFLIKKFHAQKISHIPGIEALIYRYEDQIKNLNYLNNRNLMERFKDFCRDFSC